MYSQNYATQYAPPTNKTELLAQINSADEVQRLINSYLGLSPIETVGDNKMRQVSMRRISRPIFTYEFIQNHLRTIIDGYLNFSIQFSRWERERITIHCLRSAVSLGNLYATIGDDNYISERSWALILQIHNSEGGWKQFGVTWEYDKPVNSTMLNLVRQPVNDETDQTAFYSLSNRNIIALIEGSFNKGYAHALDSLGQLPKVSTEIRQENTVIRDMTTPTAAPAQGGQQWK